MANSNTVAAGGAATADQYNNVRLDALEANPYVCQGRLSLASGDPTSSSDETAKTVIYYTQYVGDKIALNNGGSTGSSDWQVYQFDQPSIKTTDTQTGSSIAEYIVTISKVLKEGDALHVLVANNGTVAADLTDWKLTLNKGVNEYIFPSFTLNPNSIVTVHTHKNLNTATDLYGSNFTWNGTRDVELIDQTGKLVSEYALPTS